MRYLRQILWWAATAGVTAGAGAVSDGLQRYRELDAKQRISPRDGAVTKAWLDEAARLATLAADHIERGRYEQAVKLLRATERPLRHAPSWNNLRGYAEFKTGNPQPALYYLQRALQLEPQNEDYLLDIGEFLGRHRAHDAAVRVFQVAAKRMPHSPRVTLGLAVSYILQNRSDEAQKVLEQLLTAYPRFEPAYRVLGECYEAAGNAARMVELGKSLQHLNGRNPVGWYLEGAGLLHEARGSTSSLDAAAQALRKAVQLDPSVVRAHFVLARALQEAGDDEGAMTELRETLRMEPDHERAHYVLGRLYQKTGENDKARLEFEKHKNIKERDRNTQYRRLLISIRDAGGQRQ